MRTPKRALAARKKSISSMGFCWRPINAIAVDALKHAKLDSNVRGLAVRPLRLGRFRRILG